MAPKTKRERFAEFVVAFILFLLIALAVPAYHNFRRARVPVSAWFEVEPIQVEITTDGDVLVEYERRIKKEFFGDWAVEINNLSTGENVCYGSGSAWYSQADTLPDPITLEWFIGRSCFLPAGEMFSGSVSYVLKRETYPDKFLIVDILPFPKEGAQNEQSQP